MASSSIYYIKSMHCSSRMAPRLRAATHPACPMFARRGTPPRSPHSARNHHQPPDKQHHLDFHGLEDALEQIGAGRFQTLLLASIGLVWAGDAAEVMVLSYLGPAVSVPHDFEWQPRHSLAVWPHTPDEVLPAGVL